MKNIFIILYILLITSCFNFDPLESTIFFKNNCAYKIEVYGGNNIHPNKFILKEGESIGFSGASKLSQNNDKFFVINGIKKASLFHLILMNIIKFL